MNHPGKAVDEIIAPAAQLEAKDFVGHRRRLARKWRHGRTTPAFSDV
jgi:hypothetical protein